MRAALHRQLAKAAIWLGPKNVGVQFLLKHGCREHACGLRVRDNCVEITRGTRSILISKSHFIHARTIARQFETFFHAVECETSSGRFVVDYSTPRLHTLPASELQFELAAFAEDSSIIDGYFRWYKPKRGDCVFDLGANCGLTTYYFSKLVGPEGRVVAFEPDPLSHSLLLRNIARHGLQNVTVIEAAIGGRRGWAPFYAEGTMGSCLTGMPCISTVAPVRMVETLTLGEAFGRWGPPDFCKMDIEGAEIQVLAAASGLLTSARTHFAIDTSHAAGGKPTAAAVESVLRSYGFRVESGPVSGMMTTWAKPRVCAVPESLEAVIVETGARPAALRATV